MININGNYYQNPTFPANGYQNDMPKNSNNYQNDFMQNQSPMPSSPPGNLSVMQEVTSEQSYIENILRLNKGKRVNAHFTYPDSGEWKNKIYSGIIEEAGKDHLVMSDPTTGNWYLLRMIYLDYVEFMEKINYSHNYSEKTF